MAKISKVWDYFPKEAVNGKYICSLCLKKMTKSGNTTNLRNHLQRVHKINLDSADSNMLRETSNNIENFFESNGNREATTSASSSTSLDSLATTSSSTSLVLPTTGTVPKKIIQPRIQESFENYNSYSEGGAKYKIILNAIIFMMVMDTLPYSFIENKGFTKLMKILAPSFKLPCRKTLKSLIKRRYDLSVVKMRNEFKDIENAALTLDLWTDCLNTTGYIGVTIHYIKNFCLKAVDISIMPFNTSHTSENIVKIIEKILKFWEISIEKIHVVVTDNGSNVVKAIKDLFGSSKHLPCTAHTLNLVVHDALDKTIDSSRILEKVKSIVTFFKRSSNATNILKNLQQNNFRKLIQDISTRWNSTFYMCERFNESSSSIASVLLQCPNSPPMLTLIEMQYIRDIVKLLKPFENATKEMSSENFISISKIIPMIYCIKRQLNNVHVSETTSKQFKNFLETGLSSRFQSFEQKLVVSVPTILDPRFKRINFEYATNVIPAVTKLKSLLRITNENYVVVQCNDSVNQEKSFWSEHEKIIQHQNNSSEMSGSDELTLYLKEKLEKIEMNPLTFWKDNERFFPKLSKICLQYFVSPASSVPSERLFSKAGNIMTEKRNRLKPESLQILLFLSGLEESFWII